MRLRQFFNSQLLEIKPSLGDGHCLLYSVCASFNNLLTYLDSINKSSLITTIRDEVHGNTDAYLVFYTKSRSEFFDEFDNYIKYKRYNYELRDVHPLETAGNGAVYIHRKGDHYNGIVYRSARFVHVSPSKKLSFVCPESSSVVTSIVSKTASGHYSPPSARSSGSATSHPPVPSMHHGRSTPSCCPSYDVPRPPSVESSNFPTASDQRSELSCGPSPWTSCPLSSGTSTFSMLSHGSYNSSRSSSAAPRPHSAVSLTLVMPSYGLSDRCGPSSVAPRLLPTVASTAHHQRSAAFCGPSSAVPLPLSEVPLPLSAMPPPFPPNTIVTSIPFVGSHLRSLVHLS